MQTVTLLAEIPPKGNTAMAGRLLVRGNERKRIKAFLKYLSELEARDGKVVVVEDPGNYHGQLFFDEEVVEGISGAASTLRERALSLLATRT